jgi:hypothetical protein
VIWSVRVNAAFEDGTPYWAFEHSEVFVQDLSDEEANHVELSGRILRRLDEAAGAIAEQANVDLTRRTWEGKREPEDPDGG